jgi:hypothetical protein
MAQIQVRRDLLLMSGGDANWLTRGNNDVVADVVWEEPEVETGWITPQTWTPAACSVMIPETWQRP